MFQFCNDVTDVVKVFDGQDPKLIVREMQQEGFLRKCGNCPTCPNHPERKLVANKHYKGGYGARCPGCRKFTKLTGGTFFEGTRLPFSKIFLTIFIWCCGVSQRETGRLVGMGAEHMRVDYFSSFRDVCSHKLMNTPA